MKLLPCRRKKILNKSRIGNGTLDSFLLMIEFSDSLLFCHNIDIFFSGS